MRVPKQPAAAILAVATQRVKGTLEGLRGPMQQILPLRRFSRWVLDQIIQDVPEDVALCEFDCPKLQCTQGEWETCERRLNRAQGELMPPEEKLNEPAA